MPIKPSLSHCKDVIAILWSALPVFPYGLGLMLAPKRVDAFVFLAGSHSKENGTA